MCKSDSIFFYLQNSKLLEWLSENYFLLRLFMKGNWTHLAQKNSQPGSKINTYNIQAIMKMYKLFYHKNILQTSGLL